MFISIVECIFQSFDLSMSFQYRDSYVYAAGNDTDDALNFIEWLPTFQVCESKLRIFNQFPPQYL